MTISTTVNRNEYPGAGSVGPYAYNFRIFAATDLRVVKRSSAGVETVLTNVTHYTVAGVGSATGTVTLVTALAVGETLVIRRVRPLTQLTSIRNQGEFLPATHEDAFDHLIMVDQQQQEQVGRSIKIDETLDSSLYDLTLPTPRANEVLGWNTGGDGITSYPASTFGATASSLLTGIINVKDVGATGDGVTDDRAALAAAQTAAGAVGTLYFPPGSYKIASDITFTVPIWLATGAKLKPAAGINVTVAGAFRDPGLTQVFDESAGRVYFGWLGGAAEIDVSMDYVRPEWWGAKADNATNSTAAFNSAINQGVRVKLAKGVYLANCVHTWGYVVLDGAGNDATKIQSVTVDGYAWLEKFPGSAWRRHATFNDLCFLGDNLNRKGFCFGEPGAYTAAAEYYGRCEFNRVQWKGTKIGVAKFYGNMGNIFNSCTWHGTQDHCYYANGRNAGGFGAGAGIMQTGADIFNGGHMDGALHAAIYIDDQASSAGQHIFNGLVIEGCPGFGVFVYNYINHGSSPFVMRDIHCESNGISFTPPTASVTINGNVYNNPGDYYLRNIKHAELHGCKMTGKHELVGSRLLERGCLYYQNTVVADATSVRIVEDQFSSYGLHAAGIVVSYKGKGEGFGVQGDAFEILPRSGKSYAESTRWAEPYDGAGPWAFTGTAAINATSVADGRIFASCAEIVIPTAHTAIPNVAEFTWTTGKWYVYSIDMKLQAGAVPGPIAAEGTGTFSPNFASRLVLGKWITVGGVGQADTTSSASFPRIRNDTGANVTLRFSAAQVVEFDTELEAINFFNAQLYRDT